MSALDTWKNRIDERLAEVIDEGTYEWNNIPHVRLLFDPIHDYLDGGKRFRALMAVAAYLHFCPEEKFDIAQLLNLCCAIELYQASALIHDDIIDQAEERRGKPSLHITYAKTMPLAPHATAHRPASYGQSVAILAGDLCLSLADRYVASTGNIDVIRYFSLMTSEVAIGQFLDIRADATVAVDDISVDECLDVVLRKSANYSVVHPAALGALLGGASPVQLQQLHNVTEPWGLAFQLRDDELGVTGKPEVTGKPVGNDLLTGKKTPLLAMTMERLEADEREYLTSVVGTTTMTDNDMSRVVQIMKDCGAFHAHEEMIAKFHIDGDSALEALGPHGEGWMLMRELGYILTRRDA